MLKGKTALVTGSTSGIGLVIARALANDGANIMLNGFGDKAGSRGCAPGSRMSSASRRAIQQPTWQAGRNRRHDGGHRKGIRRARHAGQQCRHSARRLNRGFPGREMGCGHRHQSVVVVPYHPCRRAWHEDAQMGPHHQYRLRTWAGRERPEGGLRRGQARCGGPDQSRRDRNRQCRHHLQCHLPRLGADGPGGAADRRTRQSDRPPIDAEKRVLLSEKQPMHKFTTPDDIAALAVFLAAMPQRPSPARPIRSTAAGPRSR